MQDRVAAKKQASEDAEFLYQHRGSAELTVLLRFMQHELDETKTKLLTCNPQEFTRLQGYGQAIELVIARLTRSNAQVMRTSTGTEA